MQRCSAAALRNNLIFQRDTPHALLFSPAYFLSITGGRLFLPEVNHGVMVLRCFSDRVSASEGRGDAVASESKRERTYHAD